MAVTPEEEAAVAKLKDGYYTAADYDAGTNPGGLYNDGHSVNMPPLLKEAGLAASYAGKKADEVASAASMVDAIAPAISTVAGISEAVETVADNQAAVLSAAANMAAIIAAPTHAATATTKANEASDSATAAAASAAGVNLPALSAGQQSRVLRPKSDGTGYELQDTNGAIGRVLALVDVGGNPGLPAVDGSQLTGIEGPGLVPLGSPVVATNVATVDIEFTADGTYDNYVLMASNVTVAHNGTALQAIFKIGGSYLSTSSYKFVIIVNSDASGATFATTTSGGATDTKTIIVLNIGNTSGYNSQFKMLFNTPSSTTKFHQINIEGSANNSSGNFHINSGVAGNTTTGALTGFRFFCAAGNILTGTFQLYGIKKGS